jgi:hypothetical protein
VATKPGVTQQRHEVARCGEHAVRLLMRGEVRAGNIEQSTYVDCRP